MSLEAHAGDNAYVELDNCPEMILAKILVCEMTFVSPEHRKDKIHKYGHMHLDDFADRADQFPNELVIAAHLSTRYHRNIVRRVEEKRLPGILDGRLKLWL